jgi:hypothetical protein
LASLVEATSTAPSASKHQASRPRKAVLGGRAVDGAVAVLLSQKVDSACVNPSFKTAPSKSQRATELQTKLSLLTIAHSDEVHYTTSGTDLLSLLSHDEKMSFGHFTRSEARLTDLIRQMQATGMIPSWISLKCKPGNFFVRLYAHSNEEGLRSLMRLQVRAIILDKIIETPEEWRRRVAPAKLKGTPFDGNWLNGVDVLQFLPHGLKTQLKRITMDETKLQAFADELADTLPSHVALTCRPGGYFLKLILHPCRLLV